MVRTLIYFCFRLHIRHDANICMHVLDYNNSVKISLQTQLLLKHRADKVRWKILSTISNIS